MTHLSPSLPRYLSPSLPISTLFLLLCGIGSAQTKFPSVLIIPQPDPANGTGTIAWQELRANGANTFTWKAPDALAASVVMKWPIADAAGFLYSDGVGNTQFLPAGTCGVSCVDLTTAQTITGVKTFQNGLIMQGTSYVDVGAALIAGAASGSRFAITSTNINHYNSGDATRVYISDTGGGSTTKGVIYTYTGASGVETIFNSMGATGFDTAGTYRIGGTDVIDASAAGFLSALTIPGATTGFCWTATNPAGLGAWAACSAGGSFITTNTTQTGLTGNKSTAGLWTFSNDIHAGSANAFDFGTNAAPWRVNYAQTSAVEFLEIVDSSRTALWRLKYGSSLNSLDLYSGSGAQLEMTVYAASATNTAWGFRGSLYPLSVTGANGDIGLTGTRWRDAYFSGIVEATAGFVGEGAQFPSTGYLLIGVSAYMNQNTLQLMNSIGSASKVILSSAGSGSGIIRTFDNVGTFQNSMEANGIQTNVAFRVGPYAGGTTVIDNLGNAVFATIKMTTAPSAGYLMTSDASGNGTWQAPAGGSFVTTNTNQAGLSGTKAWSNLHTFNGGVEVKLLSTARSWYPEADDAYYLGCCSVSFNQRWKGAFFSEQILMGVYSGLRSEITPGSEILYNGSGARRVQIVQPGSSAAGVGIIRTLTGAAGVETIANSMDATGFDTTLGYRVNGTAAIDSSRNAFFSFLTVNSNATISGNISAVGMTASGAVTGASAAFNALTLTTGVVTVGHCWTSTTSGGVGAWQACGSGSFITASSAQTGLSGAKQINASNAWVWGGASSQRFDISDTSIRHYNSSNALRIQMTNSGVGGAGIIRIYSGTSGSESVFAGMDSSGFYFNGSYGLTQTLTVRNSAGTGTCTIQFSIGGLIATTC